MMPVSSQNNSLAERLCTFLNNRFPQKTTLQRHDIEAYCEQQLQRAPYYFDFYRQYIDFTQKTVLDLGCGWGANTVYCAATCNCKEVTGADFSRLLFARQFAAQKNIGNIDFVDLNSDSLPFADSSFDTIISQDTFEHVRNIERTLRECHRVLKKDGILATRFNPLYYSRYGAHLYDYITIPWCQLLFSQKTLINIIGTMDEVGIVSPKDYAIAQFVDLNKLTVHRFKKAVAGAGFKSISFEIEKENSLALIPVIGNLFRLGVKGIFQKK